MVFLSLKTVGFCDAAKHLHCYGHILIYFPPLQLLFFAVFPVTSSPSFKASFGVSCAVIIALLLLALFGICSHSCNLFFALETRQSLS